MVQRLNTRPPGSTGFSLVELLVVMLIAAMILAFGVGVALQSQTAPTLASGVLHIKGVLDQARQTALSSNKYVQVRFYKPSGGERPGYTAIGFFLADSPFYGSAADYQRWLGLGAMKPAARPQFLPSSLLLPDSATEGRFLNDLAADNNFVRTGQSRIAGQDYDWVAFYFLPDGTTDFQYVSGSRYDVRQAHFAVVARNEYERTAPNLPPNYAIFAVPPSTGRPIVFRP